MLKELEKMALKPCIFKISQALSQQDWMKMQVGAHQLKAASAYVGAGRIYYTCYQI